MFLLAVPFNMKISFENVNVQYSTHVDIALEDNTKFNAIECPKL